MHFIHFVLDDLKTLEKCCDEGISGEWEVNDEGFSAMNETIDTCKRLLNKVLSGTENINANA